MDLSLQHNYTQFKIILYIEFTATTKTSILQTMRYSDKYVKFVPPLSSKKWKSGQNKSLVNFSFYQCRGKM